MGSKIQTYKCDLEASGLVKAVAKEKKKGKYVRMSHLPYYDEKDQNKY